MTRQVARVLAAPLVATLVGLAGCTGTASSVPTPPGSSTPGPTSTAAPTASADPVAAFLAQVGDTEASGVGEIAGSVRVGEASGTLEGEIVFSGSDVRSVLTARLDREEHVAERVVLGESAWERVTPGPWLAATVPPADVALPVVLGTIDAVEEVDTATDQGRLLHRLRVVGDWFVPPAAVGLTDPVASSAAVETTFLAESDGTPRAIEVVARWDGGLGAREGSVEMEFEVTVVRWQSVVTIRPPSEVWSVHVSEELGYSMAYPPGWTVGEPESGSGSESAAEAFSLDGVEYVHVATQELPDTATTQQFRDAVVESARIDLGGPPERDEPLPLGGQPAHRLIYRLENDEGEPVVLYDYVTVRDGIGWEVYLATVAGDDEARELAFFETFIATFSFLE